MGFQQGLIRPLILRAKQNAPDSFESWDVCRSALPQVLLNRKTNLNPHIGKWLIRAITSPKVTSLWTIRNAVDRPERLLCWNQIKLAGRFLIEQRALFRVAAAPVFVSTGDA